MSYKLTHEGYVIKDGDTKVPTADTPEFPNRNPEYLAYRAWLSDGNVPQPADPLPQEEILAAYTAAMDGLFNSTAQARRYDNRVTCALRAGYPGPFQAEGLAFAQWMDACNALGYQVMGEVLGGLRPLPTVAEFLALLPVMEWPQ